MNVILGVDGSAGGQAATVLESVLDGNVPEWLGAELRQHQSEAAAAAYLERTEGSKRTAEHRLNQRCGELPKPFHGSPVISIVGHAAREILSAIDSHSIDLVILGARSRGTIGRLILGSTSEHLLAHAPCSVLIARLHEKP